MGFQESMQTWFVTPTADVLRFTVKQVNTAFSSIASTIAPKPPPGPALVYMDPQPLWKLARSSGYFISIAGLSGASAVALGAYGTHAKFDKTEDVKLRLMFEAANKYHFIHTLALLGVPLCHYPKVTGTLLTLGMVMFCGTCYYRALTGNNSLRRITPIGGTILILAWMSMFL